MIRQDQQTSQKYENPLTPPPDEELRALAYRHIREALVKATLQLLDTPERKIRAHDAINVSSRVLRRRDAVAIYRQIIETDLNIITTYPYDDILALSQQSLEETRINTQFSASEFDFLTAICRRKIDEFSLMDKGFQQLVEHTYEQLQQLKYLDPETLRSLSLHEVNMASQAGEPSKPLLPQHDMESPVPLLKSWGAMDIRHAEKILEHARGGETAQASAQIAITPYAQGGCIVHIRSTDPEADNLQNVESLAKALLSGVQKRSGESLPVHTKPIAGGAMAGIAFKSSYELIGALNALVPAAKPEWKIPLPPRRRQPLPGAAWQESFVAKYHSEANSLPSDISL